MNKQVIEQLNKVSVTKVDFNEGDTEIFIPRTIKILNTSLSQGEYYVIKLNESVVHPPENSTLASNWNRGIVPEHDMYFAEITDKKGNMIRINGVATEFPTYRFCGWIPIDGFEVISKL